MAEPEIRGDQPGKFGVARPTYASRSWASQVSVSRGMFPSMLRGAAAGGLATGIMSLVMLAAKRMGLMGELPPEKITSTALNRLGIRPSKWSQDVLATAAHLGFGATAGSIFAGIQRGTKLQTPPILAGMVFGAMVWLVSYKGWVPALRFMPPPERDRPGRPQSMLFAHLVYGAALGAILGGSTTRRQASRYSFSTESEKATR